MKNFEVGSWSSFLFRASAPLLIKQLLVSACCLAVSPSASSSGTEDETKTGGEGW